MFRKRTLITITKGSIDRTLPFVLKAHVFVNGSSIRSSLFVSSTITTPRSWGLSFKPQAISDRTHGSAQGPAPIFKEIQAKPSQVNRLSDQAKRVQASTKNLELPQAQLARFSSDVVPVWWGNDPLRGVGGHGNADAGLQAKQG